ncbi:DNA binding protein [Hypocenomyce scalaris]|nr:DNA binding protein [Hypocenomyce scalaris]
MTTVQALRTRQRAKVAQAQEKTLDEIVSATKTTSTVVQAVDQQQSFDLVQTLLMSSFANLAYLRNLFPYECFANRYYAAVHRDVHCSYKDFVDGNLPGMETLAVGGRSKESSQPSLMVLLRGKTPQADKLLEWLDSIFDALHKKLLAAVQLSIIVDEANPSNVIETYTFSFTYTSNANVVGRRLAEMVLSGPDGKQVTIQDARSGLWSLVRQFLAINNFLPNLPDTRFLTCHLFYTPDCPRTYDPPGFATCSDFMMRLPNDELWKMDPQKCGRMDSGFHRVALEVAALMPASDNLVAVSGLQIPQKLKYPQLLSRTHDFEIGGGLINVEATTITKNSELRATYEHERSRNEKENRRKTPLRGAVQSQDFSLSTVEGPKRGTMEAKFLEKSQDRAKTPFHSNDGIATQILSPSRRQHEPSVGWAVSERKLAELKDKFREKRVKWWNVNAVTPGSIYTATDIASRIHLMITYMFAIDYKASITQALTKRMQDEGFLVRAFASQGKVSSQRGHPKFVVNQDPVVISARDQSYFSPLMWIDHHYELRQSNLIPGSQIASEMSASVQMIDGRERPPGGAEEGGHDSPQGYDSQIAMTVVQGRKRVNDEASLAGGRKHVKH